MYSRFLYKKKFKPSVKVLNRILQQHPVWIQMSVYFLLNSFFFQKKSPLLPYFVFTTLTYFCDYNIILLEGSIVFFCALLYD